MIVVNVHWRLRFAYRASPTLSSNHRFHLMCADTVSSNKVVMARTAV